MNCCKQCHEEWEISIVEYRMFTLPFWKDLVKLPVCIHNRDHNSWIGMWHLQEDEVIDLKLNTYCVVSTIDIEHVVFAETESQAIEMVANKELPSWYVEDSYKFKQCIS